MPYRLSATLTAHSSDVRAVASPTNDLIISGSRDATAIPWQRDTQSASLFHPAAALRPGSRYVNAVAYLSPTPEAPQGYAVTAGQDTTINVFRLGATSENPDFTLVGHTENVCTLDVSTGGTIVSGSWDRTAKVWKNFKLVYDLKGHQQSVWAVLAVDEDQVLTGSADKTIKLWDKHKNMLTFQGHRDAVRGLALVPDIGFASCSNDSEIRVWTLGGDSIYTLSGHTSFVYSLSVLPSGDIVSGGEDRTVRVWKDGECSQVIVHPAISVWAVSNMPNGDVVSGCSDGVVRVFSQSEERWASQSDLKEYDDKVASQALPAQQVGDVKKSDLPSIEALSNPGKKEGEVKMVNNNGIVEAHQWDGSSQSWQKIGDVVDAVGQGRKQLYQGKEYDYVFDVDIQDGVPPLKLPYNATENPYSAAQRFLQSNELPLTYIDEVVKFIEKNTSGVNIGAGNNEYVDPYTGASRYQSSSAVSASSANAVYQDPYTGASRYSGQAPSHNQTPSSDTYMDPFTGSSRYSGAPPPASAPASAPTVLPVSNCVYFKQANVAAMQSKLYQFDDVLKNEISTTALAMWPEEHSSFEDAFTSLSQITSGSTPAPQSSLKPSHVEAIINVLNRWPLSQRFPVIDLCRLVMGFFPGVFAQETGLKSKFVEALFKACDWTEAWSGPSSKSKETNILLLLRTMANAFQEGDTLLDGMWVKQALEAFAQVPYPSLTKTQRVALATILFNTSCIPSFDSELDGEVKEQRLTLITRILEMETSDAEALYRALVALGNVVYHNRGVYSSGPQAQEIRQLLNSLPSTFSDDRIKNICNEIAALM